MDEEERRKARRSVPENISQRPWISISQGPRATNLQDVGKKWPRVTAPPPLIWKLFSCPILPLKTIETLRALRRAAFLSKGRVPTMQGEAGGSSHGDALVHFRHGSITCGCAHCHQRQPHLGAKLRSASSRPISPRLMTAYTRTSPLSQDDPNAYFTSTCC